MAVTVIVYLVADALREVGWKKEGKEIEAEGIACAHLTDSFAIGFASEDFWKNNISFNITVFDQTSKKKYCHSVFCISDAQQFEVQDFVDWAIQTLPIKFKPCNITQDKKSIHIRDDHGKEILKLFKFNSKTDTKKIK